MHSIFYGPVMLLINEIKSMKWTFVGQNIISLVKYNSADWATFILMKYSRISGYNFYQFQLDNALYCKIRLLIVVLKIITRFKKAMLGKLLTVQKKFSTCSPPMPKCNDLPKYFIQTLIYSFKRAIITCQENFQNWNYYWS